MSCTQREYFRHSGQDGPASSAPAQASVPTSRALFVSNEPEAVSSVPIQFSGGTTNNLFKIELNLTPGTKSFRVFPWHRNVLTNSARMFVHLAMRLSAGTGTVANLQVEAGHTADSGRMGRCLAKVQLYGSFDPALGDVSLSTNEASVWNGFADLGQTLGAVLHFDVTATQTCTLYIRTLVSLSTALAGSYADPLPPLPVPPDPLHVRGYWEESEANLPCGTFDLRPDAAPPSARIGCCKKDGPEELAFPVSAPGSTHNRGLYGVNLHYIFTFSNSGQQGASGYAFVESTSENTLKYWGAMNVASTFFNYEQRGLEPIGGNSGFQWAGLTTTYPDNPYPIVVPGGDSVPFTVHVANAGGAATPFNLVLGKISVIPVPPEDPVDG